MEINDCDSKYEVHKKDANELLRSLTNYNVVDLDPFGSSMPFIDSAINVLPRDGGLLCATFTDLRLLAGGFNPGSGYYKYGATPLAGVHYGTEQAMRIALYAISCSANRSGRIIQPLLSLNGGYYIKLFVRVVEKPSECEASFARYSSIY